MKCRNCGAELASGVAFCRECGTKVVQEKRFCRECGSELAEGVKFCSNCGASVVINKEQVEDQTPSRNTEATAPKIKSPDLSKLSETTTRLSDAGQRVKASAQKAFSTSKTSQPKKKPLTVLAAVVVVILLISLITNIGGSKNKPENESSSSNVLTANKVFDEITPVVSATATIEPGTEYAYMADAWNVYIAKAVSSNVIKVESWNKSSQSDKKMKLRGDLGSYKIGDEANGFSWIDDEHTAFTLTIQDKNNSEVKKPTAVVFTINISDSDTDKGTDYDESIACYEYANDDWHTYRAIALTDKLIKIECWYRTSSGFFDRHRFGWDVGVINLENTNTDFEWGDEEHNAFTITMIDPANGSYWKEEKLTSFILENEGYKYSTVLSYLGKTSETGESATTETPQRNGFDSNTNRSIVLGGYTVEVPTYWTSEQQISDGSQWYAETDGKVAMLQITCSAETDPEYEVSFEGLMSDNDNMIKAIEKTAFKKVTDYEVIDTGSVKGILYKGIIEAEGVEGTGYWFAFPSEVDRSWCALICCNSNNTEYLYDEDFMQVITSIKEVQAQSTETVATKDPEPETEKDPEPETEKTPEQDEASAMPVMAGTKLDTVIDAAKAFDMSRAFNDMDFGHGTKMCSLASSNGGLTLDIIYSSSTKEVLCGSIVTFNNLASGAEQKAFIKAMAEVLCPDNDKTDVVKWVTANVGSSKETTIGDFVYEVGLGPADNALYYAGERNWEEWELSFD